jgi:hypothetical protein
MPKPAAAGLLLALLVAPAAAQGAPVHVGGDPHTDACSPHGEVALPVDGRSVAIVRAGPGGRHAEVARLKAVRYVLICERRGRWLGIVFPEEGEEWSACGIRAAVATRAPYAGPCRSGWIRARQVATPHAWGKAG